MRNGIMYDESDIYELLNYNNDNDIYNDNYELDEITSKRIKGRINKKLFKKKRVRNYIAVALVLICIGGVTIEKPAFAAIIKEAIIQKIEVLRGNYADYEKYTKSTNLSSYDKGIKFIIKEIASDDNEIMISYSIISDENLKEVIKNPNISNINFKVNGKELVSGGYGGNGNLVNDKRYDGVLKIDTMRDKLSNTFYLEMNVLSLDELDGNWKFNMKIDKNEINEETKNYEVNKDIDLDGDNLTIKRISISPLSTAIEVSGAMRKYDYFLFDDKGNMINARGSSENESGGEMHFNGLINSDTKSLTFLPYVVPEDYNPNPRIYDMDKLPIELSQGELGKLVVNNLEWTGDNLKVSYSAEGKIPINQSQGLCLQDEDGKLIIPENEFNTQINPLNQHDFSVYFKGVSKDKKYKIATLRLEEFYKIKEKEKFTIELK